MAYLSYDKGVLTAQPNTPVQIGLIVRGTQMQMYFPPILQSVGKNICTHPLDSAGVLVSSLICWKWYMQVRQCSDNYDNNATPRWMECFSSYPLLKRNVKETPKYIKLKVDNILLSPTSDHKGGYIQTVAPVCRQTYHYPNLKHKAWKYLKKFLVYLW